MYAHRFENKRNEKKKKNTRYKPRAFIFRIYDLERKSLKSPNDRANNRSHEVFDDERARGTHCKSDRKREKKGDSRSHSLSCSYEYFSHDAFGILKMSE